MTHVPDASGPTAAPRSRFGAWVVGLGPGAIPLGVALLCLIGFGLPLVLVLANPGPADGGWPPTEAEVVKVTRLSADRTDPDTRRTRKVTEYVAVMRYTVDGVEYERSPGPSEWQYRVGDTLTVYYDGTNPEDIRTYPAGKGFVPWLLGGMGAGFVAIFGLIGLFLIRKGVSWPSSRLVRPSRPPMPTFDPYRPDVDSSVEDSGPPPPGDSDR